MSDYLTEARITSLKQYLTECAAGSDRVDAWRAHKDRMGERYEVSVDDAMARFHLRDRQVRAPADGPRSFEPKPWPGPIGFGLDC